MAEAVFPVELIQRADASESDFENDCSAAWKYPVFLQHPIGKRDVIHTTDPVCTIFPRVLRWRARQRVIAADVCVVSTTVESSGFKALLCSLGPESCKVWWDHHTADDLYVSLLEG